MPKSFHIKVCVLNSQLHNIKHVTLTLYKNTFGKSGQAVHPSFTCLLSSYKQSGTSLFVFTQLYKTQQNELEM